MDKKWDIYNIIHTPVPVTENNPILASLSRVGEHYPPGFDMHFALELGIVISGKTKFLYRNWETELDAGKIWLCGIWEPHGWEITGAPFMTLMFQIWPLMLSHLRFPEAQDFNWMAPFTVPPDQRPRVLPGGLKRLNELSKKTGKILSNRVTHPALWLRQELLEILLEIQTSWEAPSSPAPARIIPGNYVKIAKAVEMAFACRKFIPEKEAAAKCGMSRNSFNKNFKDLMGMNFPEFALCHRLSNAAGEILETDTPIKSIALNWGFSDISHFLRCFRRHYLCTPAEYRENHNSQCVDDIKMTKPSTPRIC